MARHLVANRIAIVYGGGKVGLMGMLADAALEAGGEVLTWTQLGLHRKPCGILNIGSSGTLPLLASSPLDGRSGPLWKNTP